MSDPSNAQETHQKDSNAKALWEKARPILERARQNGFVSEGSDDKAFTDEVWGENGGDTEG